MHYYPLYRPRELARLQIVLKRIWCWTHDCPLFRLQRRGNVVPAWIVVIALWTTVSLSTASRLSQRLCRRLCLLYCPGVLPASWHVLDKASRPRCFQRAIDEPLTLPLSPPKGGSKREFLHLALPFISSLQVIVDSSNLICGLNIASPILWKWMTKRL